MANELFSVKHCKVIICYSPPDVCPVCKLKINYQDIPPTVSLTNPIQNCHDMRRLSAVIKPTQGTWISAVNSENDLHIGATSISGGVTNYFWNGVQVDNTDWEQSIVLYEVPPYDTDQWEVLWTKLLRDMSCDKSWSVMTYSETEHNCFDFVIEFLKRFCVEVRKRSGRLKPLEFLVETDDISKLKNAFVCNLVKGKMKSAAHYIELEQNVKKHGYTLSP